MAPSGNQLYFGPCYTGGDFDVSKKIDFVGTDWMQQEYVKTSDTVETVAWVFLLYGGANGGGTGYVDRVTWEPKGEE